MYNNDNEYTQQRYETNYEFNPEFESEFENENFENEFEDEYGSNREFNMEDNYEDENEYEDEYHHPGRVVVRDHRTGSRPVIVPTRAGTLYHNRQGYRPPHNYNRMSLNYRRTPISTYGRSNYYGHKWPHQYNQGYNNRYRNYPYNRWNSGYSQNQYNNTNQSPQYSQDSNVGQQPVANPGSGMPNDVLDTIRNLSQQIAATNANVQAIQSSIAGLGNPGGGISQGDNSTLSGPIASAPPTPPPASGNELEMEDYEYDMEDEMMNYNGGNELNEMELAAELLSTNNDKELDHFLGGLVGGTLKKLIHAVAKKALPIAGAAAGTFFGGPLGAQVGEKIGSAAAGMFELELEGLSNEDQEFEVAKAIVRLAKDAADELANTAPTGDPNEDAKNALIQSAVHNAPGLLVKKHHHHGGIGHDGHWHRRGNRIIIENAF